MTGGGNINGKLSQSEIFDRISNMMVEMFELDAGEITLESRLMEDLDLDSIDAIDMVVRLQEMTGKKVEEAALRSVRTVGDVVELVDAHLEPAAAAAS